MAQQQALGSHGFEVAKGGGLHRPGAVRVCDVLGEANANFRVSKCGLDGAVAVEDEATVLFRVDVDQSALLKTWGDELVIMFKAATEFQNVNRTIHERKVAGVFRGIDRFGEPVELGGLAAASHFMGGLTGGNEGCAHAIFGKEPGPILVVKGPAIEGIGDAGMSQAIRVKCVEPGMVEMEEDGFFFRSTV